MGLAPNVAIVTEAHDQCAAAVGCGALNEGQAPYILGTLTGITTIFSQRRAPDIMIARNLNTEHHAVPGMSVSFIYNLGGAAVKWFRGTFAACEHREAAARGEEIYPHLFAEMPADRSSVLILTDFEGAGTRASRFHPGGVIAGLRRQTTRGDILKGIVEGSTFDLKERVESLAPTEIQINDFRVGGGGSRSDAWIQVCADILGRPFFRPRITEVGTLGAAMIAGIGGVFPSFQASVESMVHLDRTFEPDARRRVLYEERFDQHRQLSAQFREATSVPI